MNPDANRSIPAQDFTYGLIDLSGQSFEVLKTPDEDEQRARTRATFTDNQVRRMVEVFQSTPSPDAEVKASLATELQLTVTQVDNWFRNRRVSLVHGRESLPNVFSLLGDKESLNKAASEL